MTYFGPNARLRFPAPIAYTRGRGRTVQAPQLIRSAFSPAMLAGLPYTGMGDAGLGIVWFVPLIISAAISAASTGASVMIQRNRASGAQKVGATNIVNDVERQMQSNLAAWNESTKYATEQRIALETYDKLWDYLTSPEGCGNAALGDAGRFCISERSPEGQWPYKIYYRDPIENDPDVKQDPANSQITTDPVTGRTVLTQASGGTAPGGGVLDDILGSKIAGLPVPLVLAGGLALAAVLAGGGSGKGRG